MPYDIPFKNIQDMAYGTNEIVTYGMRSLPYGIISGGGFFILYRWRWQVELVFKRLKGIIGVGHLPKKDPESCIAWLYGKMFVALLVERLYREADFFPLGGTQ